MSKCEVCGTYAGGGALCTRCETLSRSKATQPQQAERAKCSCGRDVMAVGAALCDICWRTAAPENPYHRTSSGRDLYAGLGTTLPHARYVCPGCSGTVVPRVCFGGISYYQCTECGVKGNLPPHQLEPYEQLTPEELIAKLADPKRMMFGPPRAIRELRKKEGRNIYTGEPLEKTEPYELEDDEPPPF